MSFSVTILGSSSAKPTLSRHPSAQVVNVHEQYYLVDAGEGVQQQLIRYGINPLRLRAVFISHLHGDHVFGLFPLISTLALYGRKTPLRVFAPAPMGEILACHLKYFDSELPYPVVWTEVDTTKHALLMENRTLEVWSIPLRHRVPTAGFLFREKEPALNVDKFKITKYGLSVAQITAAKRGEDVTLSTGEVIPNGELTYRPYAPRSYAYLSDTNFSAKAAALAAGADLMYHEATYAAAEQKAARERGHSTTTDAAKAALKAGANLDRIFQTVESLRKKTDIPLVFLTYLNPVFRYGYEKFFARCAEAGVDGVIIPDLPFEEKGEVTPFSRKNAVNLISLVAPTSEDRIRTIAADADGFLYLVSSMGVTGIRKEITTDLSAMMKLVREASDIPAAVGFGISTPEQAAQVAAPSDGAIVGSAIVRIISKYGSSAAPHIADYVRQMKAAVQSAEKK